MTIIFDTDTSLVQVLGAGIPGDVAGVGSATELSHRLADDPVAAVVVIGPSIPLDLATELAAGYRVTDPSLSVILVRRRVDSTVLSEALRAGMRDVVESRDLPGLAEAVERGRALAHALAPHAPGTDEVAGRTPGHLVTVFSTKGGVGKTTVTTNLGVALAARGKRVCIVDLDVHNGDVALMLQVFPNHTLAEVASFRGAIDPSGVDSLVTTHEDTGLGVLAAPIGVESADSVNADDVVKVLQVLTRQYDVVVADTSGTFDDYALNAIDQTDLLLLVGTLDTPALKNLKLATTALDLLGSQRESWRVVLNRADPRVGLTQEQFADTLGLSVTTAIPSSREVLAAVNRGEPIVQAQPRHEVSRVLENLADHVLHALYPDERPTPGRRRRLSRRS